MLSVSPLPPPVGVRPGPIRTESIVKKHYQSVTGEPTTDLRHCGIWFVLGQGRPIDSGAGWSKH
jgi:hypothetical protein